MRTPLLDEFAPLRSQEFSSKASKIVEIMKIECSEILFSFSLFTLRCETFTFAQTAFLKNVLSTFTKIGRPCAFFGLPETIYFVEVILT